MHIHHVALWVRDIEMMKNFYVKYFKCTHGEKYINPEKGFESYFLNFEGKAKLEIMKMDSIPTRNTECDQYTGIIHFAISTGDRDAVIQLTDRMKADGYTVISHPRETGDGYFESVILDPEGNRVEITE